MLPQRVSVPLTQDLVAEDGYNPDPVLEIETEKRFTVFKLTLTFQKIRGTFQRWEDWRIQVEPNSASYTHTHPLPPKELKRQSIAKLFQLFEERKTEFVGLIQSWLKNLLRILALGPWRFWLLALKWLGGPAARENVCSQVKGATVVTTHGRPLCTDAPVWTFHLMAQG